MVSCPESVGWRWMVPVAELGPPAQDKRQVWSEDVELGLESHQREVYQWDKAWRCSAGLGIPQIPRVGGASWRGEV